MNNEENEKESINVTTNSSHEEIYKHIIKILKNSVEIPITQELKNKSENQIHNTEAKVLLDIFEIYKDSTHKVISDLNNENIKLKNEIRRIFIFLKILIQKIKELKELNKIENGKKAFIQVTETERDNKNEMNINSHLDLINAENVFSFAPLNLDHYFEHVNEKVGYI